MENPDSPHSTPPKSYLVLLLIFLGMGGILFLYWATKPRQPDLGETLGKVGQLFQDLGENNDWMNNSNPDSVFDLPPDTTNPEVLEEQTEYLSKNVKIGRPQWAKSGKKGDQLPQILNSKAVEWAIGYPEEAYNEGIEGIVKVKLKINEAGNVISSKIIQKADPVLNKAVEENASALLFSPCEQNGTPIAAEVELSFSFQR